MADSLMWGVYGGLMKVRLQSLGRPATFLLPSLKLQQRGSDGRKLEERVHDFLLGNYSGYTTTVGSTLGYWMDEDSKEFYGEHRVYTVSFLGKDRIPGLTCFLAELAHEMGEQCIYLTTGEDAWLVYPETGIR